MNTLTSRTLSPFFSVAPQLSPEAMVEAARVGFKSVINNRPDFEHGPDQPTSEQIEAAAVAAGLEYRFLPVDGAHQTSQQISDFADLLRDLPAPVLAFCRSGARSTRLYDAAQASEGG
ncbi:MAG: TIGR01244 family sulfur transferase [Rubrivivax sp.]